MEVKEDFDPPHDLSPPEVDAATQERIASAFDFLKSEQIDFSGETRLKAALGKSYHDVIRIFCNHKLVAPDAVLIPNDHDEVQRIVDGANAANIILAPIGGQSNVVGALTLDGEEQRPVVYVDMQRMHKLLSVDEENLTAEFEAGVYGPHLEEQLEPYGLTLGHFPQSFEYSTLGGWVVTRSAGQESTYYGKIEDMVISVTVACPMGTLQTSGFDKDAEGINATSLFIGSEGLLGVVTKVKVRLHRKPKRSRWVLALFPDFESGVECLKDIVHADVYPSVCRLSDGPETYFYSQLKPEKTGLTATLMKRIQEAYLKYKDIKEPNFMMLRFEELEASRWSEMSVSRKIIERHGGALIPSSMAKNWEENRFHTPYLRDTMMQHRIFVDTMETAVPWDKVMDMHRAMTEKLRHCDAFGREKGILMGHISHMYTHGACMYFILICPMQVGREVEQWEEIKQVVSDTIVDQGGSISHHHSVGKDHQEHYLKRQDPNVIRLLSHIKSQVDPNRIMNPGKLFDRS